MIFKDLEFSLFTAYYFFQHQQKQILIHQGAGFYLGIYDQLVLEQQYSQRFQIIQFKQQCFNYIINNKMNLQSLQQELNNPLPSPPSPSSFSPPFTKSLLIGYLYFVQGILLSLPSSLILTYSKIPEYSVLSWFAAVTLPFSFKFLSAPLVQKYTSVSYGRRKTWIIIPLLLTSLCLWILSHYTSQQHMMLCAVSFIFIIFLISIQDISTDALGIKELKKPELVSFLQTLMQQIGLIFGSMVFIKLTSSEFAINTLGLSDRILTPSMYFKIVSVMILIPLIVIHFRFQETLLEEEKQLKENSLFKIMLNYRYFVDRKSRYFRQAFVFLVLYHGLNYFDNGYQIELMKNGFSKETLNTIENIILLPLLIVTYLFSYINTTAPNRNTFYLKLFIVLRFIWQIVGFLTPSFTTVTLTLYSLVANSLKYMLFIRDMNNVNGFPPSALLGMLVTGLYSSRNLGVNGTVNMKVISWVGYEAAVVFGFCYTLGVILVVDRVGRWMQEGTVDVRVGEGEGVGGGLEFGKDEEGEQLKEK